MQWKWLKSCLVVTEISPFHVWNGFVEEFSMDGKLSRRNQWTLCAIIVGTGSLLPQSDAVEMTEKLSGGHLSMCRRGLWKAVFYGWKTIQMELVDTLFHCSGHRKFVAMVRCSGNEWKAVWYSVCRRNTTFPCVEGVCGRQFSMAGKLSMQMESVDTLFHCSGHRNFVAMVRCSGSDWKATWWSQRYHLSMCGRGLWSVEKFSIGGNGRKRYHRCLYSIRYSAAC